jgi:hypothetical protein
MVEQDEIRLIETRAKALLALTLTSRPDLILHEQDSDYGVDFMVSIRKNGTYTSRLFGILLKASVRDSTSISISLPVNSLSYYKDTPFPLCLCYFFMSNDKGFYKWLIEPAVDQNGSPRLTPGFSEETLHSNKSSAPFKISEFTELDQEGLSHLVNEVNAWYDARRMS